MRCAISGAGLTLSRLKGIASPAGEIFRKKMPEEGERRVIRHGRQDSARQYFT